MDFSLKNKFIYALVLLFQLHFFQSLQGQNINYVPLNTQSTLLNKTINTNLPVGATVAEARVSQYGAAKYSIPIVVPPGTNGIIPQIAVEYNSQAGNGVMGLGWNISSLSTITRSGQSIYFDGKTTAVNFSSDDRYYLDGQRLIQKSGTYGNNGSTYRTESESFASITSYCSANGKPQWFKVELKDGTVMEYGKNLNSTLYTNNYSDKMLWRLNRISYKDGNFIDFEWVTGYRDNRISEIRYTGNSITGQSPYNVVRFHYKERADKNAQYENGSNIGRYYLLDRIEVNAEQQTVKNYEFKYSFDGYRSILNSIAEKGSDGSSLNSTIFRYGDQPSNFNTVTSSVTAGTAVDLFSGDFDGDGYSDILTAPYVFNNGFRYNTDMTVYKRTATNATFSQSYSTPLPADFQIVNGINSPNMYNFMASDYTGDGRDDIMLLKMRVEGSQNWRKLKEFKLYESTGISFNTSVRYPDPNYDIIHPSGKCFYPGDFDGDGATDYITFLSNASGYRAFVSFPRRNIYNQQISGMGIGTNSATAWVVSDFIYVIDFDGDGKQELMRIKDATTEIYTFEKSGNSLNATAVYQASYPTKWHRLYFGDFNGDRKTDMLVRTSQTSNNASWEKSLSTGVNFFVQPFSFNKTPDVTGTYSDDKLVISDFNGDGLMDILHGWNNPGTVTTTSTIGMYYSRGTDFRYETNAFNSLLGYASWINSDLNGDGRSDIINRTYYGTPFDIFYFKSGGEELLMKDAVDGHLSRVIFDYQRMNETQGGFYNKGSHVGTAMNTVQLPMQLAYRLRKDNGIGS
ncbi:MAG: FG-GAP-like repeat-containing protein, partial [Bacteroidota bacterium]